jgi:hypothetical protein
MPTTAETAFRTELNAALDVISPQLRGLKDIAAQQISADLMSDVQSQTTERQMREDAINAVLAAMDLLDANGYPDLPGAVIQGSLFAELQEHISDVASAAVVFQAPTPMAERGDFNAPTAKIS